MSINYEIQSERYKELTPINPGETANLLTIEATGLLDSGKRQWRITFMILPETIGNGHKKEPAEEAAARAGGYNIMYIFSRRY